MRLVIDTNVLLSALMTPASPSAQILVFWRSRKFELVTASEQLDEIARVTRYPKIRATSLLHSLDASSTSFVTWQSSSEDCRTSTWPPDPDDNFVLALAEAGDAQFLVTGDKPLLALMRHKSTHIITPAALIALLKQ